MRCAEIEGCEAMFEGEVFGEEIMNGMSLSHVGLEANGFVVHACRGRGCKWSQAAVTASNEEVPRPAPRAAHTTFQPGWWTGTFPGMWRSGRLAKHVASVIWEERIASLGEGICTHEKLWDLWQEKGNGSQRCRSFMNSQNIRF